MSSKVDVSKIVTGHFKTLTTADGRFSASDLFTFILVPVLFAGLALTTSFKLTNELVSLLVNFGAIYTGLLLSVLVLVYDQENKHKSLSDREEDASVKLVLQKKRRLLNQLYYNISFSILASISLVLLCFIALLIAETKTTISGFGISVEILWSAYIVTPLVLAFSTTVFLNVFMIVKRLHALLTTQEGL